MKIVIAWFGFFAVVLLLVFAVISLKRFGVLDEAVLIVLSAASWVIIYQSAKELVLKTKHERLPFFSPNESFISNIFLLVIIISVAIPIVVSALYPLVWLVK